MKTRQIMALSLSLVLVGGMFASCGSEENSAGVDVVVAASYVPEETTDTLQQALDGVYTEESGFGCTVTGVTTGDTESDPMMAAAGIMKVAGMVAADEIDVLVASLEEGERQAQNGGLLPLSEVFTEEELAEISLEQISFDITDSDGNSEEEFSEPCGFKLTGETVSGLDSEGVGVFIVSNTDKPEESRQVMETLMEMYG